MASHNQPDTGGISGSREPNPSSTGLGPSGFDPGRKWTPGPWSVEPSDRMGPAPFITATNGHRIAQLEWNGLNEPQRHGTANARLIAASPELYHYLDLALKILDRANVAWGGEPAARAVLAKARGEQPCR